MTAGRLAGMRTLMILLIGSLLTACSTSGASTSPAAVVTAAPSPTVAPVPTPTLASTPSASPAPAPSPTATPEPSFVACALPTWHAALPSGRLVDIKLASTDAADTVVFKFAPGGDNPGTPTGTISAGKPPFTESGSGKLIKVVGNEFLQVKFEKMTLEDASGPVFTGKHDFMVDYPALRQVINYDEFEGYSGWIVGMDKPTCVTVASDPKAMTVTLTIAHS